MGKIRFMAQRGTDIVFRGIRKAEQALKAKKIPESFLFFPLVQKKEDLADLLNRANWYFPERGFSDAIVRIPVASGLFESLRDLDSIETPKSQERFIRKNSRIKPFAVANPEELEKNVRSADAILLWKMDALWKRPSFWLGLDRIWIVDSGYFLGTEARNYVRASNAAIPGKKMRELLELSKANFAKMLRAGKKFRKAYVFGTGPSVSRAEEFDFSGGYRFAANTIINDEKLMRHIKPQALVFGDFIYHMGPSLYASKFRQKMAAVCRNGCAPLVRFDVLPLLLSHYPDLKEQAVAMQVVFFARPNIPSEKKFFVKLSNNSLVTYMLPIASAMVDEVFALGCDGRKPGDKLFWSHAKTAHYDDLTQTLVDTHPSVYRDTDYSDFFEQNAHDTEEFMSYAEKKGKRFFSLAPSHIPALKKREWKKTD